MSYRKASAGAKFDSWIVLVNLDLGKLWDTLGGGRTSAITDDTVDLGDVLPSFAPNAKASLHERGRRERSRHQLRRISPRCAVRLTTGSAAHRRQSECTTVRGPYN